MNLCGELVCNLLVGDVGVVFDGGEDEVLLPLVEFWRSPRWFLLLSPLSSHLLPESESPHCYPIHSSNFFGAFPRIEQLQDPAPFGKVFLCFWGVILVGTFYFLLSTLDPQNRGKDRATRVLQFIKI